MRKELDDSWDSSMWLQKIGGWCETKAGGWKIGG